MTYLVCIGDIYFHPLGNNPCLFLGMEFWAPGVGGGVAPKAKGKGRSILVNGDASTFARVLPVPNDRMQTSSMRTLDVSPMYSIFKIMQGCAYPRP